MGKQPRKRRSGINRDEAARRRLFKEKGINVNQHQPGEVVVTQTDLLAQIGALTMENTVLKNQLGSYQQIVREQAARIEELQEPQGPPPAPSDGSEESLSNPPGEAAASL